MAEASPYKQASNSTSLTPLPPALPTQLTDPIPAVAIGSGLFFAAFIVLLVLEIGYDAGSELWMWTCLAGGLLGFAGIAIIRWQQSSKIPDS